MKTKVLSTLVFSTLLFASMYSEARRPKDVKDPALRTKDTYQGAVNQFDPKAVEVTEGARRNGEPVPGTHQFFQGRDMDRTLQFNGDLLRSSENGRGPGVAGRFTFDTSPLVSANQSRGLLPSFTNRLTASTVNGLKNIVNGPKTLLKSNLLGFQQAVVEGKAQLEAQKVKAIAYLIAKVNGTRDVRNPNNQDPGRVETVRDMLHNLEAALLTWTKGEGRLNYFGVLVRTAENLRSGKTFKESFDVALAEAMNIREERAQIAKRWEIKRNCRGMRLAN